MDSGDTVYPLFASNLDTNFRSSDGDAGDRGWSGDRAGGVVQSSEAFYLKWLPEDILT